MPIQPSIPLATLAATLMYVMVVWLLSLRLKDSGIMDVFWGPGFVLVLAVTAWLQLGLPERAVLVAG